MYLAIYMLLKLLLLNMLGCVVILLSHHQAFGFKVIILVAYFRWIICVDLGCDGCLRSSGFRLRLVNVLLLKIKVDFNLVVVLR